jgi:[ribosomal protein S5]-alanine N-acetyltransferase
MSIDTAFSQFPILKTQRFILRQLRPTDVEAIFAIFSNPEVMKYAGRLPIATHDEALGFIERMNTRFENREGIRWGITRPDDDTIMGTCSFHHFISEHRCVETGYDLNRAYWGQGIQIECMPAVLAFGFQELGVERIEAIIDDVNTASKKLLLKLGFTYEGCLRHRFLIGDRLEDEFYYGLLKSDWLNTHS